MSTGQAKAKQPTSQSTSGGVPSAAAKRCRQKFLRFFPAGFRDETYIDWERDYKWNAHEQWNEILDQATHRELLQAGKFSEVAARAVRIESRTNLLFSFEKMALRDAVKSPKGARLFAEGLYDFLYGKDSNKCGRSECLRHSSDVSRRTH